MGIFKRHPKYWRCPHCKYDNLWQFKTCTRTLEVTSYDKRSGQPSYGDASWSERRPA